MNEKRSITYASQSTQWKNFITPSDNENVVSEKIRKITPVKHGQISYLSDN